MARFDLTDVERSVIGPLRVLDRVTLDGLCALSERRNGDTTRFDQLKHMNQAEFANHYLELLPKNRTVM